MAKSRLTLLVLCALALALTLAACDTEAEPEAAPAPDAPEAETPEAPEAETPEEEETPEAQAAGEAPMLAELVEAGELPPVEERLPADPMVVEPVERVGDYGGTWRTATTGAADTAWWWRTVGYDHLVRTDAETAEILPNVARDWDINDDGHEYIFHLREGMKWSDGEDFTAHDISFWYNDFALHPELGGGAPSWMITGDEPGEVEAIDDYTVAFRFSAAPNGLLLQNLAANAGRVATAFPAHYLGQFHEDHNPDVDALVAEEGQPDWVDLLELKAGTASQNLQAELPTVRPWVMMTELGEGATITWERNPYYWKVDTEGNQLPYLDEVIFNVVEDPEVIVFQIINGELNHHARHVTDLPNRPLLADHRDEGDYRFYALTPGSQNYGNIALNWTHKDPVMREIFHNKDFRIGLSHAIDRQEIIDVIYQGQGEPWQGAPRPESRFYDEEFATQYLEYDVDLANEHLDRAFPERDAEGYRLGPDGNRIAFDVDLSHGGSLEGLLIDAMELIGRMWAEVGIEARPNAMDRSLYQVRTGDDDHDALIWTGWGGDDLTVIIDPRWYFPEATNQHNFAAAWGHWYHGNPQGEEPPEAPRRQIELYRELRATADPAAQDELMREILDIAKEQFYVIGIALPADGYGIASNDFRNIPERMPDSWPLPNPGLSYPEQYFVEQQ